MTSTPTTPEPPYTSTPVGPKSSAIYRKTPWKKSHLSDDTEISSIVNFSVRAASADTTAATSPEAGENSGNSSDVSSDESEARSSFSLDSEGSASDISSGPSDESVKEDLSQFSKLSLNTSEVVNSLGRDVYIVPAARKLFNRIADVSIHEEDSDSSVDTVSFHTSKDMSESSDDRTNIKGDLDEHPEGGNKTTTTTTTPPRGRPSACIFVASLSSDTADSIIHSTVSNHFAKWGELLFVKVLRDNHNRPYAFVQYANEKDAKAALENSAGDILNNRHIRCEPARVNRSLYIRFHDGARTEQMVKKSLSEFGEVEKIIPSEETKWDAVSSELVPVGWFIQFAFREDAIQAYAYIKDDKDAQVSWTQNPDNVGKSEESTMDRDSIFISNISPQTNEEELVARFENYGKIISHRLIIHDRYDGKECRAFAFITYDNSKSAALAIERENFSVMNESKIYVQYRLVKRSNNSDGNNLNGVKLAPPPVGNYSTSRRWSNSGGRGNQGRQDYGDYRSYGGYRGFQNHSYGVNRRGQNYQYHRGEQEYQGKRGGYGQYDAPYNNQDSWISRGRPLERAGDDSSKRDFRSSMPAVKALNLMDQQVYPASESYVQVPLSYFGYPYYLDGYSYGEETQ